MGTIQVKRGIKSHLPSSAGVGEPLYTTDTKELFIGNGLSNSLTKIKKNDTSPIADNILGVTIDSVRGYCDANADATGYGDLWNKTLARVDLSYEISHKMGIKWVREWAQPKLSTNWMQVGDAPIIVSDSDGWEALDRSVQNAKRYGMKIIITLSTPYTTTRYNNTTTLKNYVVPQATYIANRYKTYSDTVVIEPCNELSATLMGMTDLYPLGWDASNAYGLEFNPIWMDFQAAVYDAVKAVVPDMAVQLSSWITYSGAPNMNLAHAIDQMRTRNTGYGAGIRDSSGKRWVDIFDDTVDLHLYPYKDQVVAPNYYNSSATITNQYDISTLLTNIKAALVSAGRPEVTVALGEFGLDGMTDGKSTFTNGSNIVTGVGYTGYTHEYIAGDKIVIIGGSSYTVASVNSDSTITLTANYTGTTGNYPVYNPKYAAINSDAIIWLFNLLKNDERVGRILYWNFWGSTRVLPNLGGAYAQGGQRGILTEDTKEFRTAGQTIALLQGESTVLQAIKPRSVSSSPTWALSNELFSNSTTNELFIGKGTSATPVLAAGNATQIQGRVVSSSLPNNGDALAWDSTTSTWGPSAISTTTTTTTTTLDAASTPTVAGLTLSKEWASSSTSNILETLTSYGDTPRFVFKRAGGTVAATTAAMLNDTLGSISARGYYTDGTPGFPSLPSASIQFAADENFTSTSQATRILFQVAPSGSTTQATAMVIKNSGCIGIGNTAPDRPLVVDSAGNTLPAGNSSILLIGESNKERIEIRTFQAAGNISPSYMGAAARGTKAAPVAVYTDDELCGLSGFGWNGTAFGGTNPNATAASGIISIRASEPHTTTTKGSDIRFFTSLNGTTVRSEKMRISNEGYLGIGSTAPAFTIDMLTDAKTDTTKYSSLVMTTTTTGGFSNSSIIGRAARGYGSSLFAIRNNDSLLGVAGRGYDGTSYNLYSRGSMLIRSAEDWTTTANGTFIALETTSRSAASRVERMRIASGGQVGISTTAPLAMLDVKSSTSVTESSYTSGSLSDITMSGVNASATGITIQIQIDSVGANDTFKWQVDGGAWSSGLNVTTTPYALGSTGISVKWNSITGHKLNSYWIIGVAASGTCGTPAFYPQSLRDFICSGTYTGDGGDTYTFVIDSIGTPDTFKWKKNSGNYTTGVAITGANQTIAGADGIIVKWTATTGHTINDQWTVTMPYAVLFEGPTGLPSLTVGATTGNVGIGAITPDRPLVVSSINNPLAAGNGTILISGGNGTNRERFEIQSFGPTTNSACVVQGRTAGNTGGVPSATLNGHTLMSVGGGGHDGTAFGISNRGYINIESSENWATTKQGTRITFGVTIPSTLMRVERFRIGGNGNVGIGTTNAAYRLDIQSSYITTMAFSGTGLNDLNGIGQGYNGSNPGDYYTIKITTTGAQDKFQWSKNGGALNGTDLNVTTTNTTLSDGVTVSFLAITGHTVNDSWTLTTALYDPLGVRNSAGNVVLSVNEKGNVIGRTFAETSSVLTATSNTFTPDLTLGSTFPITLGATNIIANPINPPASGLAMSITFILKQDATGGRDVSWGSNYIWGEAGIPNISTSAANTSSIVTCFTVDGGITWMSFLSGKGF